MYILPEGDITVSYKLNNTDVITKTFRIVSRMVYPETMGALYITNHVNTGTVAVVDIGHLNMNLTVYTNLEVDRAYSLTNTLGGNNLVTGLAQELSSSLMSLVDEKTVARALLCEGDKRCLHPNRPNKEIEEKSKKIIDEYTLNHVEEIRRKCDNKQLPVDFIEFIFIGGTSVLLKKEIRDVFGESVVIPDNPEFVNTIGFLRVMCGKLLGIKIEV